MNEEKNKRKNTNPKQTKTNENKGQKKKTTNSKKTTTKKSSSNTKTTKKPATKQIANKKKTTKNEPNKSNTTQKKKTNNLKEKQSKTIKAETISTPKTENILPNKQKKKKKNSLLTKTKKQIAELKNKIKIEIPEIFKEIDYKQILFKLFLLLIIMILLIFMIVRMKKHYELQNTKLNENTKTILNASLKYYQENTLPINIGDSSSFLLEEMKNLNLIPTIKDEKDRDCNHLKSYTILTKIADEEYHFKLYLKCPAKKKIVEEKIIYTNQNNIIKK